MAPHRVAHHVPSFLAVASSWAAEMPAVAWFLATAAGVLAVLGTDPFTWALGMLVFASALDYLTGVATAKGVRPGRTGAYDSARAARGRREKIITVLLMIGCRMVEGLATAFGILSIAGALRWVGWESAAESPVVQQGGIFTTVATILITIEELNSVYEHRLQNGGSRILVLEVAFSTSRALQRMVLGKVAERTAAWAGIEAADHLRSNLAGMRRVDEMAHAATHDGEPAPRRRHTDAALDELAEPEGSPPHTEG
jgi:hypothetical protein